MEEQIKVRLDALEKKIDAVYVVADKTRKYFLIVVVVTVVATVLPILGLMFAVPSFISTFQSIDSLSDSL